MRARGLLPLAASLVGLLVIVGCRSTGPRDIGGVMVDIRGEEAVAEADLYDLAARELGDFARDRLRAAAASDAAFTMEHGLADRGYAHARVTFELLPGEEAPSELIFHVVEGPRAELGEVTFPGRRRIDEEDIRALLVQRFQLSLLHDRWYRRSQIDEAVGQIEALYAVRGHHRARVGPPVVTWNQDQTKADVAIPIREGRRFTVSRAGVVPRDPEQPLPEELRTTLRSLEGAPFHRRLAADAAARVRGRLRESGYQFAEATGRWELDGGEGPPTATIVVEADAGVRQFVRSWNIAGLERSEPAFMESLIDLPGGDLVRQSVLNDAIDALYDTGAFGSVNITSQLVDEPGGAAVDGELRDLTFVVEEKDARSFEVGGGWGSYEQIRGWVGYRDRNFMGIARIFDVVAHGSAKSLGVTSRVTDRYILGTDRTLSVGARLEKREEPSYDSTTFEGDVTARQRLGESNSVFVGYRMRIETADDRDARIADEEEDRTRAAGLFTGVRHDTRDDRLFPTDGVLSEVSFFWSDENLLADLDFLETKVNWSRYVAVGRSAVLAFGFRFTTRDVQGDRKTLPIQERLFLGGETSVRSFGESELGPVDRGGDALGGLTSAMATVELRRSIWRDLDGALFYDYGTVSPDSWDISSPAGAAIGIGLRYRLPVGPLRLDFAYNPRHRFAASRKWALHLSFGFSF